MAIDFPNSPAVDEIYSVGDKSWLWNGTYWEVQGSPTSTFSASDTAPSSPSAGDIWYRSDTSQTLIYYDSTWVEIGHSANIANFLADADADTKIQLEESSDEDTIRFDIAGSEKMALNASSLTVYDSLSVGSGASASSFNASGSGANLMPSGTTAERPASPTAGMFRFNETTGEPEWYSSALSEWIKFQNGPTVTISYLVVAGGGSSGVGPGGMASGGGGAGGLLSGTTTVTPGSYYDITIGAGGVAPANTANFDGTNGSNSSFDTFLSIGGGYGATFSSNGGDGGSGGGAAGRNNNTVGGSPTAGQGYAGGNGNTGQSAVNTDAGGGGGGAGGAGANATDFNGGAGGVGLVSNIITTTLASTYSVGEVSGSSVYFAGGGGGAAEAPGSIGSGGLGGGGDAAYAAGGATGQSGAANSGGGGGGAGGANNNTGGNGGSGVTILRYPSSRTLSIDPGLTSTTSVVGSDKVTIVTAGTGTVSWA